MNREKDRNEYCWCCGGRAGFSRMVKEGFTEETESRTKTTKLGKCLMSLRNCKRACSWYRGPRERNEKMRSEMTVGTHCEPCMETGFTQITVNTGVTGFRF